jgi:hypothetical protein
LAHADAAAVLSAIRLDAVVFGAPIDAVGTHDVGAPIGAELLACTGRSVLLRALEPIPVHEQPFLRSVSGAGAFAAVGTGECALPGRFERAERQLKPNDDAG